MAAISRQDSSVTSGNFLDLYPGIPSTDLPEIVKKLFESCPYDYDKGLNGLPTTQLCHAIAIREPFCKIKDLLLRIERDAESAPQSSGVQWSAFIQMGIPIKNAEGVILESIGPIHALSFAAIMKNPAVCVRLIDHYIIMCKKNPLNALSTMNAVDIRGNSALHFAAISCDICYKKLKVSGINTSLANVNGHTAEEIYLYRKGLEAVVERPVIQTKAEIARAAIDQLKLDNPRLHDVD